MFTVRMFRLYLVVFLALFAIVLQASLFNSEKIYTVATEFTEDGEVIETPKLVNVNQHRKQMMHAPKARVEEPVYDFGRLAPLTTHQHTFVIHNEGSSPLELTEGPATCKCTVATLTTGAIPPGGKGGITMQWNTGRDPVYAHSATIYTNDPRNKSLQLKVKGRIQVLLQCKPKQLVFSRVEPGETPSASTVVYSQVWEDFTVSDIAPSLDGVVCTVEDTTKEQQEQLQAKAAYQVTATLPNDLPAGYFTIPVKIKARGHAQQSDEPKAANAKHDMTAECELVLEGKILRRLSVYGPHIDSRGMITLGRVIQGKGKRIKLLLKLRDTEKTLRVRSIETNPTSLNARIEPYDVEDKKTVGLYHLHIELPVDAPTFRLPPDKKGHIHVDFEHPRVTQLDLPIDVVVAPASGPTF